MTWIYDGDPDRHECLVPPLTTLGPTAVEPAVSYEWGTQHRLYPGAIWQCEDCGAKWTLTTERKMVMSTMERQTVGGIRPHGVSLMDHPPHPSCQAVPVTPVEP